MFKKEVVQEIKSHYLVTLIWFLIMVFLKIYLKWQLFWLLLGSLLGTFILDIDHLLYWFFLHPEKQDSQIAQMLWQKRDFPGLILLLGRYHDTHTRLVFHSFLFQVIFLIFSFYIFSSGGSYFGTGMVAAMNLHLLKDEWEEYREGKKEHLNDWLFWQIKKKVTHQEQKVYLIFISLMFTILVLFI